MKKILYFLPFLTLLSTGCGKTAEEYYDQGHAKIMHGDNTGALIDFNKAINIDSTFVDAYICRGLAKNGIFDYLGAISDYTKALKIEPNSTIAYYNRERIVEKLQNRKNKNDWAISNFKGTVKSVKLTQFSGKAKFGKFEKQNIKSSELVNFDRNGNAINVIFYNTDGRSLKEKIIILRDAQNNINEQSIYDSDGKLIEKKVYRYDCNDKIKVLVYDSKGSLSNKLEWNLDDNNNIIGLMDYNSDGSFIKKCLYKLNLRGKNIQISEYRKGDILYDQWNYKYDENGDLIENLKDKLIFKYEYDHLENYIIQIGYENDEPVSYVEREIEYF